MQVLAVPPMSFGGAGPDAAICANHRRYVAMDASLQASPRAISCRFFAAAACVTHPTGGLGVLDSPWARLVFAPDESSFLHHVHGSLVRMNWSWFERLRLGMEVTGCEGLRNRALDHALVQLEQACFTQAMHDHFGADVERQARVMAGINAALHRNPLLRSPLLVRPLREALAAARARHCIDLGDEAQRRFIGEALVDSIAGCDGASLSL
jgi:hypothetical protein